MTTNKHTYPLSRPSKTTAVKRHEMKRYKLTEHEKANPLNRKQIAELFGSKHNEIEGALYLQKRHIRFLARQSQTPQDSQSLGRLKERNL